MTLHDWRKLAEGNRFRGQILSRIPCAVLDNATIILVPGSRDFPHEVNPASAAAGRPEFHRVDVAWNLSDKWIDDTDPGIALAVIQILRIYGMASEFEGGRKDRGIPVGKLVALLDPECCPEHGFR